MDIPRTGTDREQVLSQLAEFRTNDIVWRDGKALAYVFHGTEEAAALAERAYQMYLWENALDPTVFPSTLRFETEIVAMAAAHLRGDDQVVGNFTSGGTESVMLAVKTARDYARARRPELTRPQMVLPVTAHPCFHKAAHYFGIEAVVTPVDPRTTKADVGAMRAAITADTVLLAASAPAYAHGAVDPIRDIGQLALDHELLFHVDGCIGGFILPFFRELGAEVTDFDFTVPGVTSISMDLHKYAFCPKGASVVLYRNADIRRHQIFSYSGWPGYSMVNPTMQSSKSGGPLAAAWAVLHYFGRDGYLELFRGVRRARDRIVDGIAARDDYHILGEPEMSLFAIGSDTINVFALCDEMKHRGWTMHPQMKLGELRESFHVSVIPMNVDLVDSWFEDLDAATAALRAAPASSGAFAHLEQAMASLDLDALSDPQIEMLLEMAGLGGGELPGGDMAEINGLLNQLSPRATDRVLTAYFNKLSRYRGA